MDFFQPSKGNLEDYVVSQLHSSKIFNRSFYDLISIHLDPFIPFMRPYSPPTDPVVITNLAKQFTPFLNKLINALPSFITESPELTRKSAYELLYILSLCVDCFEVIAPVLGDLYAAVNYRDNYISCLKHWELHDEAISESFVSLASLNRILKLQVQNWKKDGGVKDSESGIKLEEMEDQNLKEGRQKQEVANNNSMGLPQFDGTNLQAWLCQANQYFENNPMDSMDEWDTLEKVKYAYYFMTGPADAWFVDTFTTEPVVTWECFCQKMIERFADSLENEREKGNNGSVPGRYPYQNSFGVNSSDGRGGAFEGLQSPYPWVESPYFSDVYVMPLTSSPMNSSVATGIGVPSSRSRHQNSQPHTAGLHHPRPLPGMNTVSGYMNGMYSNKYFGPFGYGLGYGSNYSSRMSGRSWMTVDGKYKPKGRGNAFYGKENLDGLNERKQRRQNCVGEKKSVVKKLRSEIEAFLQVKSNDNSNNPAETDMSAKLKKCEMVEEAKRNELMLTSCGVIHTDKRENFAAGYSKKEKKEMDFQLVVLAGGFDKSLLPLVSQDLPKALLPVANRPVLSYLLELLEQNDLKHDILVVEVSEDVGTAGAIRDIDHRLTAKDILVVSGDLVTEIPPGAVAAAHRRHEAVVTAMFCSIPVSGSSDSSSAGAKDKAKKTSCYNIVGLDPTKQFLLHIAYGAEVEKGIRVQKSILRAVGQMEIRADLMDAQMYAFKRSILLDVLNQKEHFQSLRRDVLPYLVRSQRKSELLLNGTPSDENGIGKDASQNSKVMLSQLLANASKPSFHETYELNSAPVTRKTHIWDPGGEISCAKKKVSGGQ